MLNRKHAQIGFFSVSVAEFQQIRQVCTAYFYLRLHIHDHMRYIQLSNHGSHWWIDQRDKSGIILQVQDYRLQIFVGQSPERLKRPQPKGSDMEQYQEVCRITRSVPNYTCVFLDFLRGFSSYVKGLPKWNDAIRFWFQFLCICEMALTKEKQTSYENLLYQLL